MEINQRALADAEQQLLQLIEIPGAELSTPLALDDAQNLVDLRIRRVPSCG